MMGLQDFPEPLRSQAQAAIERGETVLWAGRPAPLRVLLANAPVWLFAFPWSAIASLVFASALAGALGLAPIEGLKGGVGWLVVAFSLPFLAIGILLFAAPIHAFLEAKRMGFLITDRRVLEIVGGDGARRIKGLAATALRGAETRLHADGRGTVKALGPVGRDGDGDKVADDLVMRGVNQPQAAESAIWRLAGARR